MKQIFRSIAIAVALLTGITMSAQEVNTLYFLENAPMRTQFNPALMPVSSGYIIFSPLGYTSLWAGNNSLTMADVIYNKNGQTITALNAGETERFLSRLHRNTLVSADMTTTILGFGARTKKGGYFHGGIFLRADVGVNIPKSLFKAFITPEGIGLDMRDGLKISGLNANAQAYVEVAGGYTRPLNDQWTLGGKLKFLLGYANINMRVNELTLTPGANPGDKAQLDLKGTMNAATPGGIDPTGILPKNGEGFFENIGDRVKNMFSSINGNYASLAKPAGYGAAIDFGFTYKPIENLQISAALTDLGFIYWYKGKKLNCTIDTTFTGVGEFDYNDYVGDDGKFDGNRLADTIKSNMMGLVEGFRLYDNNKCPVKMPSARLNVGLDANFWENRIGVGIVSATRLYNARLYEEITLGVAFRPVNWFNIAASYSFMDNGKFSNIGAGISLMPYDGVNMTLTMDYMPTSYAAANINGQQKYVIPDKMKMFNIALGFSICWGSNRKDKDKDGVWDKLDLCPDTPRGVLVDSVGCPLDEDHDGVPDYLDHCLGTPAAAIGFVDSVGCMLDTDGDGIEDYRDECPNTPEAAWGKVDSVGCPLDTDGDGVPDYLDECPETPEAAYGMIDQKGCPLDLDGDGVPDYKDACPGTPEAAWGQVDSLGCPLDTDKDGVPDYIDECPNTPEQAIGHVDAKGCELDSDGDGVPDYLDECPMVAGVKENKGCPEVKREVRQLLQKAMQGIEFETGKAAIKKKSFPLLNQIAAIFVENGNYIVEVQGHTDNVGKAELNKKLSEQRANSVMKYLISQGVPEDRLSAHGYGMEVPIADNKTKAGRAKNRRVEFKISFEEVHYETVLDHADPQPAQ